MAEWYENYDWNDTGDSARHDEYMGTGTANSSMVADFRRKAQDWAQKVVHLMNMDVPPVMMEEKLKLVKWAKVIKTSIEKIFGTMDEFDQIGLGIIPLIPIAAIGAALAAITKWTYDYAKFLKKVQEQRRLEATGVAPDKAAQIVNANYGDKPLIDLGGIKNILPFAIGGGLLYWLLRNK